MGESPPSSPRVSSSSSSSVPLATFGKPSNLQNHLPTFDATSGHFKFTFGASTPPRSSAKIQHRKRLRADTSDDSNNAVIGPEVDLPVRAEHRSPPAHEGRGFFVGLMDWLRHVPVALQYIFNAVFLLILIFFLVQFSKEVYRDVNRQFATRSTSAAIDIDQCHMNFMKNKCDSPVPQLEQYCAEQQKCIMRDPTDVERAEDFLDKVASLINAFVERLSTKTIVVCAVLCLLLVILPNMAFNALHARLAPSHNRPPANPPPAAAAPPHLLLPAQQLAVATYAPQPYPYPPYYGVPPGMMYPPNPMMYTNHGSHSYTNSNVYNATRSSSHAHQD